MVTVVVTPMPTMVASPSDAIRNPGMRKNSHTLLYYIGLVLLCIACDSEIIYSNYQHITIAGWEKNDAISFAVPPIQQDGTYQESVGLRISNAYPFMGLSLIVEQTVFPSLETYTDTLSCNVIDNDGNAVGQGISHYQYNYPLNTVTLHKGDSLSIHIRHDMKREILPGVANIGMILTKQ